MEAWGRATVWFAEDSERPCEMDALVCGPFAIMPTVFNAELTEQLGEPCCDILSPFRITLWPIPNGWLIVHRTRHLPVGNCPSEEQARAFCEAAIAEHGDLWELDYYTSEDRTRMIDWWNSVEALYFWPVAPGSREMEQSA